MAAQQHSHGGLDIQGNPQGRREIVSSAERNQAKRHPRKRAPHGRCSVDGLVQCAVAAADKQHVTALLDSLASEPFAIAGSGRLDDLDGTIVLYQPGLNRLGVVGSRIRTGARVQDEASA
jgi:hypothetical protein